jgi:hypothetical protein
MGTVADQFAETLVAAGVKRIYGIVGERKAAAAGYRETVGIGRPTSDQGPAGHRGNDDGMPAHGDPEQHGKPMQLRRAFHPGRSANVAEFPTNSAGVGPIDRLE